MNTKTLTKFNRFGKIGKILMTILFAAAVIAAVLSGVTAIYTAVQPEDAVKVTVTNQAEFKIDKGIFSSVWSMLNKGFSYKSGKDATDMLKGDGKVVPEEECELNTDLNFFNQSYSSATVHSENDKKIIDAKSPAAEYSSSDLTAIFIFAALVAASGAISLFILQRLFKVLSVCESPFCFEFVSKLRMFAYSLLPVAVFASVGETLAVRFLSAQNSGGISVQWGILVAFAVTMCLVAVFRYGVQLQKESDETL